MNMIEQVAKDIDQTIRDNTGEHVNDELLKRLARAAIEAMRHPTIEMIQAGTEGTYGPKLIIPVYQAMIDTALKE